jgi:tetratricopeptide (TPR) repeat protein
MGLARVALDRGDAVGALEILNGMKQAAPATDGLNDALYRAHLVYGQQLLGQGLLDESDAHLGEALALRPDDAEALEARKQVSLARLWVRMEASWGQDEAATIATLEEILAQDPSYRDANVKLYAVLVSSADRLLAEGDRDGAVARLRRAREVYPAGEEARAKLDALTPTPTPPPPPPPTPAPAPAPKPQPQPLLPGLPGLPGGFGL